jgi:hypothetical protein
MTYIEIAIDNSLECNDEDRIVRLWVEHLWSTRLTSMTYQLLYNLVSSISGPINFYVSENFSNDEILSLLKNVLGLRSDREILLINSYHQSGKRLCKIALGQSSDIPPGKELATFERYPHFSVVCVYDQLINDDFQVSTYEQRIDLPYSSGKRDGVIIEDYTSRVFLPCVNTISEEVFINNSVDQQNWFGIPRFHGEMVITRNAATSQLLSGASVYSKSYLLPGYYCMEILYTSDNSSSQMINLHALLEDHSFFDCQVVISELISPNFAVDQLLRLINNSGMLVLIYFKLPQLAEAFSSKLFLGPHLEEERSSHIRIKDMKLVRIKEDWGN